MAKRQACPACGVWQCWHCGWKRNKANRHSKELHACYRCGSKDGKMLPVYHNEDILFRHATAHKAMLANGFKITYPLEES